MLELGPEVAERMALLATPGAAIVGSFVMSRRAERAWEAINRRLHSAKGAFFWIGGPAGCGKTHFLNYVVALNSRAGALSTENARYLTLTIDASIGSPSFRIEQRLVEMIARELTGDSRGSALWRLVGGEDALAIAFGHARRQGVRAIMAAVDFGAGSGDPSQLASLARVALSAKSPRLTVIAAGRGEPPEGAACFNIAAERDEEVAAAIGRARHLFEASSRAADSAYRAIDIGEFDPRQIFPFHPAALEALAAFGGEGVAIIAELARAATERWIAAPSRLIFPSDLMELTQMRQIVEKHLDERGRAALATVYAGVETMPPAGRAIAREIADILMLRYLAGGPPLGIDGVAWRMVRDGQNELVAEMLKDLSHRCRGAIVFDSAAASFDGAAVAPEVALLNAAADLIRRFDPTLEPMRDAHEFKALIKRLNNAMANALETACRNRETLIEAMNEAGSGLSPPQEQTFAHFCALAAAGARALIETGSDAGRRAEAMRTIADYESLAALAAAAPRLRAMREYLRATGLRAALDENPARDRALVAIETECQLLLVAASPAALGDAGRGIEALEARFQKFKWTYVQRYRAGHERWRMEMERAKGIIDDARRHLAALRRLNSIAALGPPEGAQLDSEMDAIERRASPCDLDGPLSPEITPGCPRCGYVLGMESPLEDIDELCVRISRALRSKLVVLSRGTIRRLIHQHDHDRRLEGFLKIIQAAQTDVLARLLDDELAGYLTHLIDENFAALPTETGARAIVRAFTPERIRRHRSARSGGNNKPADDSGRD